MTIKIKRYILPVTDDEGNKVILSKSEVAYGKKSMVSSNWNERPADKC